MSTDLVPDNFSFELIEQINISRNPVLGTWELIVCGSFTVAHLGTWQSVDDVLEAIRVFRLQCPNARIEVNDNYSFDNTCRVRSCTWNLNDTCSLNQQFSILPAPIEPDLSKEEWTTENSVLPNICPDYELYDDNA